MQVAGRLASVPQPGARCSIERARRRGLDSTGLRIVIPIGYNSPVRIVVVGCPSPAGHVAPSIVPHVDRLQCLIWPANGACRAVDLGRKKPGKQIALSTPKLLSATAKLAQLNAGPLQASDKALEFATKARELAPHDPKVVGILGGAAYQTGNFPWAYSLLQESARQLPNDAEILHDFAWTAYSLGKVSEARQTMQRVLNAAPDSSNSSDAKLFLAMTALDQEGAALASAESEVEQALKTDPKYVPAQMAHAGILTQRGESKPAAAIYSEVLRRFPNFAPAQKRLASLYLEIPEKREEAYKLAVKAREALPDDPELAQILAELSYQRNEFAYAVQLLRQSAKKKPLDAKQLYYLGMSHLKAKDKIQSREALDQALAAGLKDPLAADARRAIKQLDQE